MTPEQLEKGLILHEQLKLVTKFEARADIAIYEISIQSSEHTNTILEPHCMKLSHRDMLELNKDELLEVSTLINKLIATKKEGILKQIETL